MKVYELILMGLAYRLGLHHGWKDAKEKYLPKFELKYSKDPKPKPDYTLDFFGIKKQINHYDRLTDQIKKKSVEAKMIGVSVLISNRNFRRQRTPTIDLLQPRGWNSAKSLMEDFHKNNWNDHQPKKVVYFPHADECVLTFRNGEYSIKKGGLHGI